MSDVSKTLEERGGRYGAFINHATIAQGLQQVLHDAPNWSKLDHDMRQAMCVICDKMARILNGDPYYEDNWHDIQGYARLVESRILEMREAKIKEEHEQAISDAIKSAGDNWEECHGKITWGPPHDKAVDPNYDVGNYRG